MLFRSVDIHSKFGAVIESASWYLLNAISVSYTHLTTLQKQSVSIHRPLMSLLMMSWLLVSQSIRHHCLNVISCSKENAIYMRLDFFLQPLLYFTAITFLALIRLLYESDARLLKCNRKGKSMIFTKVDALVKDIDVDKYHICLLYTSCIKYSETGRLDRFIKSNKC